MLCGDECEVRVSVMCCGSVPPTIAVEVTS